MTYALHANFCAFKWQCASKQWMFNTYNKPKKYRVHLHGREERKKKILQTVDFSIETTKLDNENVLLQFEIYCILCRRQLEKKYRFIYFHTVKVKPQMIVSQHWNRTEQNKAIVQMQGNKLRYIEERKKKETERKKIQLIHKLWLSLSMLIMHSTNSWILYPLDGVHTIQKPHTFVDFLQFILYVNHADLMRLFLSSSFSFFFSSLSSHAAYKCTKKNH